MGEPPGLLGEEVDKNERLRRMYYEQVPDTEPELQNYRLGHAVAASACVPGLFDPLIINNLYPDRSVKLVDGGVHDNQGVEGLLDEGCTVILCSDASGQMEDMRKPAGDRLGVMIRSNSILMARVREAEYQDLCGRVDNGALEDLFFLHLKKDLRVAPVDWSSCDDPSPTYPAQNLTSFGVDADIQARLAAIRTDLDSFTEVEANALMLSGYLMTEHEFKCHNEQEGCCDAGSREGYQVNAPRGDWEFLDLELLMRLPEKSPDPRRRELGRQLAASKYRLLKPWRLDPKLKRISLTLLGFAAMLLVSAIYIFWDSLLWRADISVKKVVVPVLFLAAVLVMPALKWLKPEGAVLSYLRRASLAVFGFLLARVYLKFFERIYLDRGKLKRVLGMKC